MKDFSKGILNYALEEGLSKRNLESNYKQLIPSYYEYGNLVLFSHEIADYVFKYRTELFYSEAKATFWLLIDWVTPADITQSAEISNEKITETSDINEIYLFIKNNLFHLEEAFYEQIIKKSVNLVLNEDCYFVDEMWNQISEYLKLSDATSEHIKEKLELYVFQDAFDDYWDENGWKHR